MTVKRRMKGAVRDRFPEAVRRWWHLKHRARARFPGATRVQRSLAGWMTPARRQERLVEDWVKTGVHLTRTAGLSDVRFEPDGVWIRDRSGALWSHTLGREGPVMHWDYRHSHAEGEIELLRSRLKPRAVLVDVGANVGTFSIQLARAVDGLAVLAVEPVPQVHEALQANIRKNGLEASVQTSQVALSDRRGAAIVTSDLAACNYVLPGEHGRPPPRAEEVPETTLDALVQERRLERVDFVKCDVEGMELRVLRGAEGVLERFSPELLLEIDERWTDRYGYRASEIFGFLDERGYDYCPLIAGRLARRSADPVADIGLTTDFLFTARTATAPPSPPPRAP